MGAGFLSRIAESIPEEAKLKVAVKGGVGIEFEQGMACSMKSRELRG